ncbi:MAG TPA: hypothetical protein VFX92_08675 [Candidatus Krumholzibacteria bacterium]|nr:hypothetical protein [Candidatus Krumholzibacteria bacterium]
MHSLSGAVALTANWNVELYGGVRDDNGKTLTATSTHTSWVGLDVDMGLGQSWYLNVSGEHNGSGDESYHQVYSSLSWRF